MANRNRTPRHPLVPAQPVRLLPPRLDAGHACHPRRPSAPHSRLREPQTPSADPPGSSPGPPPASPSVRATQPPLTMRCKPPRPTHSLPSTCSIMKSATSSRAIRAPNRGNASPSILYVPRPELFSSIGGITMVKSSPLADSTFHWSTCDATAHFRNMLYTILCTNHRRYAGCFFSESCNAPADPSTIIRRTPASFIAATTSGTARSKTSSLRKDRAPSADSTTSALSTVRRTAFASNALPSTTRTRSAYTNAAGLRTSAATSYPAARQRPVSSLPVTPLAPKSAIFIPAPIPRLSHYPLRRLQTVQK